MSDSDLTIERDGDVAVLLAPNYVNSEEGEKIEAATTALREEGVVRLVLDMSACTMSNSVGISFLIEMLEATREASGRVAFCNVTRTVGKTLQIMGLLQVATLHDSREEAVAAVRAEAQ
jgi:anti-anti-sigma factor